MDEYKLFKPFCNNHAFIIEIKVLKKIPTIR